MSDILTAENNFSMDGAEGDTQPRFLPSTNPLYAVDTTLYEAPEKKDVLSGKLPKEEPMTP